MLWLLAAVFAFQAPDEVRVSSHVYTPTLRVDTRLVEIEATVRDGSGKPVGGLTKGDFRLLDDGKERAIEHFFVESGTEELAAKTPVAGVPEGSKAIVQVRPPRYLAIFIDDVNAKDRTHAGDLKRTQVAAERFIKEALPKGVRIGIFTASGAPNLDFTTDEERLIESLNAIKPHVRMPEDGLTSPCPWVPPYLAMRIAVNHDPSAMAVVLEDLSYKAKMRVCVGSSRDEIRTQAEETWRRVKEISTDTLNSVGRVVEHLGTMPGKRDLLIASSGFLGDTMQGQKAKVIDRATQANVVINALDSKGLFVDSPADPMRKVEAEYKATETGAWVMTLNEPIADLAESTGGRIYQNNNDLAAGFRELGLPPEVTYRIGFRTDGAPDAKYHKLKISVRRYSVQARPGYFAAREPESLQARIDREMSADDTVTEFPVEIAVQQVKAEFSVVVMVDISKLKFLKKDDREVQRIAFTTALIDSQGRIVAAKEGVMDLALTEATYKRLAASGVNAKVGFQVPAGVYRLRQVSLEGVDGRVACSSHRVEVK